MDDVTEDIPYAHRFVANSGTRKAIARAFLGYANRPRRRWIVYPLILLPFVLMALTVGRETGRSLETRVIGAIILVVLPGTAVWLFMMVLVSALAYLRIVRGSKLGVFNGAVLESGFGQDEMVVRNPISSSRLAYKGIKSLAARGDFVFMKHHGLPLVVVYPRELFPDEAIERILRVPPRS